MVLPDDFVPGQVITSAAMNAIKAEVEAASSVDDGVLAVSGVRLGPSEIPVGGLLARADYNPTAVTTLSTTSTTSVDMDATYLAVSFTAPEDGAVEVTLDGVTDVQSAGVQAIWSLRSGGADVSDTPTTVTRHTNGIRVATTIRVTGLTPGGGYTYIWGHKTSSAASYARVVCGGNYGPASMSVRKAARLLDFDAAWSWWARPRAVALDGYTYAPATGGETENVVFIWKNGHTRPRRTFVGRTGGAVDDHNNGALIIEPGRVPVLLYTRHADSTFPYMKWRRGSTVIEDDPWLTGFADTAEQSITTIGGPTYPSAHVVGSDIHVIFRDDLYWWTYIKSTDWGVTFSAPVRFMHHTAQCHVASVVRDGVMRLAVGTHPAAGDEVVRYAEINLTTGAIVKSDGTALGNLDGTGLPVEVTTSMEAVATAPTDGGTHYKWVYDVGDGPDPEIVWSSFRSTDYPGTSKYRYSKRTGTAWSDQVIVAAGDRFSDSSQPYLGGAQIPRGTSGGEALVAREASGTWYVDRMTTADGGGTWATENVGQSTTRLVRAWPVEQRGATAPRHEVVAELIPRFTTFKNMKSTLVVLPNDDY